MITTDLIMSWFPCRLYTANRVGHLIKNSTDAAGIAKLDIPLKDRIWVLVHYLYHLDCFALSSWLINNFDEPTLYNMLEANTYGVLDPSTGKMRPRWDADSPTEPHSALTAVIRFSMSPRWYGTCGDTLPITGTSAERRVTIAERRSIEIANGEKYILGSLLCEITKREGGENDRDKPQARKA